MIIFQTIIKLDIEHHFDGISCCISKAGALLVKWMYRSIIRLPNQATICFFWEIRATSPLHHRIRRILTLTIYWRTFTQVFLPRPNAGSSFRFSVFASVFTFRCIKATTVWNGSVLRQRSSRLYDGPKLICRRRETSKSNCKTC